MTAISQLATTRATGSGMNVPTADQKRLVIVGATGMLGGYALRYALEHPTVGQVTAIGRRKIGISHPKLNEVLHSDFTDCSALAEALSRQDAAVFCLGTYTGVVPDAELRTITVDYTIEFARVLHGSSPEATFAFLSGSGADPTGRSRMAYARYKREGAARGGIPRCLPLPARLHLSGGAAERTEFKLPAIARDLPRVPDPVPQPGDPGRQFGAGHGGCRRVWDRRAPRADFREP